MRCTFRGHDLDQKINKTVCRYDGVPYFCRTMNGSHVILYHLTDNLEFKTITVDDDRFDVSSIPLGYYQATPDVVEFMERKPHRKWKQGIDETNVTVTTISREIPYRPTCRFGLYTQGFINSVTGKFPDMMTALGTLRNKDHNSQIAISRDIAIEWIADLQIIHVYYKTKLVGFIPSGSLTVYVPTSDMGWVVTKYLSCFNWEVK